MKSQAFRQRNVTRVRAICVTGTDSRDESARRVLLGRVFDDCDLSASPPELPAAVNPGEVPEPVDAGTNSAHCR
eukprot:9261106-Pyramimonas_sp.AAC.1